MCLLIAITGVDDAFGVLVAGNRDERRDRLASPPGLFRGARRRILSPRDRVAQGTWMAVNDRGMFAGLTNLSAYPVREGAPTRGALPHLALDCDDLPSAVAAVRGAVEGRPHSAFQLLIATAAAMVVVTHAAGELTVADAVGPVAILSNEHRLGGLTVPAVGAALAPAISVDDRLDALAAVLLDTGAASGHPILKRGGDYGTVSSSLIAVPRDDPRQLIWRYAPGPPDTTDYRNYGNLGRRLVG